MTRTVLRLFIGAVATVIHGVAQLVAVNAAVVAAAESERRLTLDVHCECTKVVLKNLHGESKSHDDDSVVCVCVEVGVVSYSTSEAPHPNCPRSRCRRRISIEAAHTRGSCTRTGRGDSRCHWRSAALRGQSQHVRVSRISVWAPVGA